LLAASALVRAVPVGSPGSWMNDMDYPAGAARRKEEGIVGFSMLIAPDGRVAKCDVTTSSGFPDLDQRTCAVMLVRTKFKPAHDENGKRVYDRYRAFLTWRLPGKQGGRNPLGRPVYEPDMILEVQKLRKAEQEHVVAIVARTDGKGRVAYCESNETENSSPQLVAIACAQMKTSYTSDLRDGAGNPLPAIQGVRIAFRAIRR
jgi:TonB family protein